jgi:AcrR family transcriptional regulator
MNVEELQEVRERILDVAAGIVMEDGFDNLSMRKIGSRMGIAAATLYYYYSNKDELNIAIRKRAGELLYDELLEAYESGKDFKDRAWLMIRAYLDFGLSRPNYYSIMFDSSAPKHSDYLGTELEEAARRELESSMRSAELMLRCMNEFVQAGYGLPADLGLTRIALWSELHGLVSLFNNHLLKELGYPSEQDVTEAARLFYDFVLSIFEPGAGRNDHVEAGDD